MFELKPLSEQAIPDALKKAERYRLLNEPRQAESICRDILNVDADNSEALATLILSLTDQFIGPGAGPGTRRTMEEAWRLVAELPSEYERAYYAGIIAERRAKARLELGGPRTGFIVYEGLREAMALYEKAEALSPEGNDDAILRWNTCARIIMNHPDIEREVEDRADPALE